MHYVMADLHGESSRYHAILTQTGFSSGDRLIVLGDVVDRGGIGGVDILLDLMERPNAVLLLGNHESMCLKAMDHPNDERAVNHWMRNGGQVTYNALQSLDKEDRERVLNYLHTLVSSQVKRAKFRHKVYQFWGGGSPQSIPAEKLVSNGLVVLEPVAGAGHVNNLTAVDEAVEDSGGNGGVAEEVGPLVKALVGV